MKTPHKWVGTSLVVFALTAGCGGGDDKTTTTTTTPAPGTAPTSSVVGARTSPPSQSNTAAATDAICSPVGAKGRTAEGIALVCATIGGGNESRWRPE